MCGGASWIGIVGGEMGACAACVRGTFSIVGDGEVMFDGAVRCRI